MPDVLNVYDTATLVNNTALTVVVTVPAGEVWYVYGGYLYNADNVARLCNVGVTDPSGAYTKYLMLVSVGAATVAGYPAVANAAAGEAPGAPAYIKGSDKLEFVWAAGGASAGGTAVYTYVAEVYR